MIHFIMHSKKIQNNIIRFSVLIYALIILMTFGCSKKEDKQSEVLIKIGSMVVTQEDVVRQIPQGLHPTDSARLFISIIDNWIKDELLADFAAEMLVDTSMIDRKVRDYRNKLLVQEYLNRMSISQKSEPKEKDIQSYYNQHKDELLIGSPLVKGIFIKTDIHASNKDNLKNLLLSEDAADIDVLENHWFDKALEYEYFADRWVDWTSVAVLIPYRFGDPDLFLGNNRFLETDYSDCSYFLIVKDYLPTGSVQPYDYASAGIKNILQRNLSEQYEKDLVESLIKKAINEKKLEIYGYDPVSHKSINIE